jgi:hypothetical protein
MKGIKETTEGDEERINEIKYSALNSRAIVLQRSKKFTEIYVRRNIPVTDGEHPSLTEQNLIYAQNS